MSRDPWVGLDVRHTEERIEFEIRLWPPTTEGIEWPYGREWMVLDYNTGQHDLVKRFPDDVDPWGEFFERFASLVRSDWLPAETFVEEVVGYVAQGSKVTEQVAWPTYEVLSRLGSVRVCSDAGLRAVLAGLLHYCQDHPQSMYCSRRAAPVTCTAIETGREG